MNPSESLSTIGAIFPAEDAIPNQAILSLPIDQREYLIDGKILSWDGELKEVWSPVCVRNSGGLARKSLGRFPLLTGDVALKALDAAVRAYDNGRGVWPCMSVTDRIRSVEAFTFRMEEHKEEIIKLLMWEIGKSAVDSRKEYERTVKYIRDTIDALKDLDRASSRFAIEEGIIAQIRRGPLGVVLCCGPFNYPLNETFTTLIPALIMGNTVVFKPPSYGVLLFRYMLEAFRDSFPPGVVNTVYGKGREVLPPLMKSCKLDVLAFIGTSAVADQLVSQHPKPHRMRLCLGLDAKNPAIILPDADLYLAVEECVLGTLSFNGQRCTALKIIFVHTSIADEFLRRLSSAIGKLKIGMPWDDGVALTPLPEDGKSKSMAGYIADALANGASVVNPGGGESVETFFYPAVLYPVNDNMKVYWEEQFGPVIPVVPFDTIDLPLNYMEESNYGAQVSIFGADSERIAHMIDPLTNEVCRVNINSQCQRGPDTFPFTGRKDSAVGTLSVADALRMFSIRTMVAAKEKDENKRIITDIVREHRSNFLSTDFIL